jgi:hypothetical protein
MFGAMVRSSGSPRSRVSDPWGRSGRTGRGTRSNRLTIRSRELHAWHSPPIMFTKQVSGPVDSLDPPSWPRRRNTSSELEERPAHGPNPRFCALQAKVILTPVRSPKANAFAERWVRTVRSELLDWTLVLGRRHFDRVLNTYMEHYNAYRPHRGARSDCPDRAFPPPIGSSHRGRPSARDVLSDLIHEYHAAAA